MPGEMTSMSKITREAKRTRGIRGEAFRLAKENNDMLYKKSVMFKKMWRVTSDKIYAKYKSQAVRKYLEAKSNRTAD